MFKDIIKVIRKLLNKPTQVTFIKSIIPETNTKEFMDSLTLIVNGAKIKLSDYTKGLRDYGDEISNNVTIFYSTEEASIPTELHFHGALVSDINTTLYNTIIDDLFKLKPKFILCTNAFQRTLFLVKVNPEGFYIYD
jgi:hypothetical protein